MEQIGACASLPPSKSKIPPSLIVETCSNSRHRVQHDTQSEQAMNCHGSGRKYQRLGPNERRLKPACQRCMACKCSVNESHHMQSDDSCHEPIDCHGDLQHLEIPQKRHRRAPKCAMSEENYDYGNKKKIQVRRCSDNSIESSQQVDLSINHERNVQVSPFFKWS